MEKLSWIQGLYIFFVTWCFLLLILFLCMSCNKESFGSSLEHFANELKGKVAASAKKLKFKELTHQPNPNVKHMISEDIDLGVAQPSDKAVRAAKEFHRKYDKYQSERRNELKNIYKEMGSPSTIVTMFYCKKFFIFFHNWVLSCEKAGIKIKDRTITFALDKEAYNKTVALGFKCYLLDPNKYEPAGGSKGYGDSGFATAMFYKNSTIYDLLHVIPEGNFVLFQDTDLIWFKDPVPYLENESKKGGYDIQIMYDGPNYNFKNLYANSGFIFVRNEPASMSVFETALNNSEYILQSGSHQKPLDRIFQHFIDHNLLSLRVLQETTFVNGHLLDNTSLKLSNKLDNDWMENSFVFHYSWSAHTGDKIRKLNKINLNYVNAV